MGGSYPTRSRANSVLLKSPRPESGLDFREMVKIAELPPRPSSGRFSRRSVRSGGGGILAGGGGRRAAPCRQDALHPQPSTFNPKPYTLDPKPSTVPQPQTSTSGEFHPGREPILAGFLSGQAPMDRLRPSYAGTLEKSPTPWVRATVTI